MVVALVHRLLLHLSRTCIVNCPWDIIAYTVLCSNEDNLQLWVQEFANQHSIQLPQRETRQNLATIYKAAEPVREPSFPEPFPSNILQVGQVTWSELQAIRLVWTLWRPCVGTQHP